jgi:hypothetical protein
MIWSKWPAPVHMKIFSNPICEKATAQHPNREYSPQTTNTSGSRPVFQEKITAQQWSRHERCHARVAGQKEPTTLQLVVEMELKLVSLVLGSNSSWIGNFNSLKK